MWRTMLFLRDVIDAGGGGSTPPIPPELGRPRKITCEFCECDLGTSGEYKKLSDKAKSFRESEEIIEKLNATISELRSEIAALKAAQPAPTVTDARLEGARHGIAL